MFGNALVPLHSVFNIFVKASRKLMHVGEQPLFWKSVAKQPVSGVSYVDVQSDENPLMGWKSVSERLWTLGRKRASMQERTSRICISPILITEIDRQIQRSRLSTPQAVDCPSRIVWFPRLLPSAFLAGKTVHLLLVFAPP